MHELVERMDRMIEEIDDPTEKRRAVFYRNMQLMSIEYIKSEIGERCGLGFTPDHVDAVKKLTTHVRTLESLACAHRRVIAWVWVLLGIIATAAATALFTDVSWKSLWNEVKKSVGG